MSKEYLPVVVLVVLIILATIVKAVSYWAKVRRERGEADAAIWEIIARALDELKQAVQDEAQKVTTEQLRATAKALYDAYIRSTALSKFISEDRFTALFFETWERVVGVRRVVAFALGDGQQRGVSPPP